MNKHALTRVGLSALIAGGLVVPSHADGRVVRSLAAVARPASVDSIYGLAVDSTKYREYSYVYLLDDGVVRLEKDGRATRTYRQVVQILKPNAVAQWAEKQLAYQPDREKAKLNWLRVVLPSGQVLSDKPSQSQESDVPVSMYDPVYTQTKVLRYSLSKVAPGTLVDASWTIETIKPPMPGAFVSGWNVSLGAPGMRSRFVLDVPKALAPRIAERHLDFKRTEQESRGRHVYTWATQNVLPPKAEIFAPDSSYPFMSINVATPIEWSDVGRWYYGLSKDRYVLTPAITAEVDSLVRNARTNQDTLSALHRWIANDLRYVSISLGIGGYQPRFPEATVSAKYGDCKDKATLFIAAARHLGIVAYPVLLNSNGGTDRTTPSIERFNHVIAAVERVDHSLEFLDLTTYAFPTGVVPSSYQGGFGLLVQPDGNTRELNFPQDSAGFSEARFEGEMTPDGKVSGRYLSETQGRAEANMRAAFSEPPDSARRAQMKRGAPKIFPNAVIDTVIIPDGRDLRSHPVLEVRMHDGRGGQLSSGVMVMSIPGLFRASGAGYTSMVERLQQDTVRHYPIDAAQIHGRTESRRELHLTLPDGWVAQLPQGLSVSGPFGTYRSEYTQTGRELRISHFLVGATGVYPPSEIGALRDWFKKLATDDAEFITIRTTRQ